MHKIIHGLLILVLSSSPIGAISAQRLDRADVPTPLKPWVDWVLHDQGERTCPFTYNNASFTNCAWSSVLSLNLTISGGNFSQVWRLDRKSWIQLPGERKSWPRTVQVDNKFPPIAERNGHPAIELEAGNHRVSGKFNWKRIPQSLLIAPTTGLVRLTVGTKSIPFPHRDENNRLWLRGREGQANKGQTKGDHLSLQVFRRIFDNTPMQVLTRIQLQVSGEPREVLLGPAMITDFIPLSLSSKLPARLEPTGLLRVQIRPGTWQIDLSMRHPKAVTQLSAPKATENWANEEIWVFDARPNLRVVEIEGIKSIDPQQTNLPQDWRKLPAYRLKPEDKLQLVVKQRGDANPAPNQLQLRRSWWLDFQGTGYTLQDKINGAMTRGWRLEMKPPIALGRVSINGANQFITRHGESKNVGVEVRHGKIDLLADSRYQGNIKSLPAVGWDHDFQKVNATLHLPPGWKLFNAKGVDNVPNTWLHRWSMLDLFLVLIFTVAVARLWSWKWGALALITLTLTWHEHGAPQFVWVSILAATALLRVLPKNRLQRSVLVFRFLSLLTLVAFAIPYSVNAIRIGLYPQLEKPWKVARFQAQSVKPIAPPQPMASESRAVRGAAPGEDVGEFAKQRRLEEAQRKKFEKKPRLRPKPSPRKQKSSAVQLGGASKFDDTFSSLQLQHIDPNAKIQTGPGLPRWQWTKVSLNWNGPVTANQTMHLTLLSPKVNLILNILRVLLIASLSLLLLGIKRDKNKKLKLSKTGLASLLLPGLLLIAMPKPALAEFPSEAILNQLRDRLLSPAGCLPQCAQSPILRIEVEDDTVKLRQIIDTQEAVAIPLPANQTGWSPHTVLVDNQHSRSLTRTHDGRILMRLPKGRTQVLMIGAIPQQSRFQISLPMKPAVVEVKAERWIVDGVNPDGSSSDQLQFTRKQNKQKQEKKELSPGKLPSFVRVQRNFNIGVEWRVETVVTRLSPRGTPIVVNIPLLKGESATSEGIKMKENNVLVTLGPNQMRQRWQTTLEKTKLLELTAPDTTSWVEVWRLNVGPIWHAAPAGIPQILSRQSQTRWLPQWQPWPGESLKIHLSRPIGVEGTTLTVDSTQLRIGPGERSTEVQLNTKMRSSQGGQHTITLPEGARLQKFIIDNKTQPLRQDSNKVVVPLVPGKQNIQINWREPKGISKRFTTPKVDLGSQSVNTALELTLARDRWILLTGGPRLGPAVLFWGVLVVIILIALGLGRITLTPLKTWHWLLLGIGLSQSPIWVGIAVVGWLLALGWRNNMPDTTILKFNLIQVALGGLTFVALFMLITTVKQGLLGLPEMQVSGNGSTAYNLNWYQDRSEQLLPTAWVISVPLFVYRILMLAWALWLAFALVNWLRWGWRCYAHLGLWRTIKFERKQKPAGSNAKTKKKTTKKT